MREYTYFEALAEIDYQYFLLRKIAESYSAPKDAISAMVDEAVGFTSECTNEARKCLEKIIELKKQHNFDYGHDNEQLDSLNQLSTTNT